ncbi:TPA: hypothetical protein BOS_7793 [Bos taurus]|nr:TPA: hypothetical protein BOS_7793 [Bos taurus]
MPILRLETWDKQLVTLSAATYLSQLGPQFCHIVLQGALVTKCGRELGLTSVEHGLQVPDTALGHRELTLPLLGAGSQEQKLAGSTDPKAKFMAASGPRPSPTHAFSTRASSVSTKGALPSNPFCPMGTPPATQNNPQDVGFHILFPDFWAQEEGPLKRRLFNV